MELLKRINTEINIRSMLDSSQIENTVNHIKKLHIKLKLGNCNCEICNTKRELVRAKKYLRIEEIKFENTHYICYSEYYSTELQHLIKHRELVRSLEQRLKEL